MAFSQQFQDVELLNVTRSVGASGANFWTDIMLVQSLIGGIYSYNYARGNAYSVSKQELKDLPDPNTDYRNSKKTEKWVRKFQNDASKSVGRSIVKDGRVDRLVGASTPITHSIYTIALLNNVYGATMETVFGVEDWQDDLLSDGNYPALMRGEILASRRAGVATMR